MEYEICGRCRKLIDDCQCSTTFEWRLATEKELADLGFEVVVATFNVKYVADPGEDVGSALHAIGEVIGEQNGVQEVIITRAINFDTGLKVEIR